jgi:GNAT superfamily N-acetyltransferase
MPIVRPAEPADAPPMVAILRAGFPAKLVDLTILGCSGFPRYLADAIRLGPRGGALYLVAAEAGEVLGLAEFRWTPEGMLLNHIYIAPRRQGQGLGRMLLAEGIGRASALAAGQTGGRPTGYRICLDVFADNLPARQWYEALGFGVASRLTWQVHSLEPSARAHGWYVGGWPQAECIHAAYGFSEFELRTPTGSYRVGRLGPACFRSTDPALLADPTAAGALSELDAARKLLYLGPGDEAAACQAVSLRLQASAGEVLARLRSSPRILEDSR